MHVIAPEAVHVAAREEFGELPTYQQQILATGFRTFIDTFKAELRKFSVSFMSVRFLVESWILGNVAELGDQHCTNYH